MSASLKIEQPGLLTTVQDRGRPGYQDAGVPPSGALERACSPAMRPRRRTAREVRRALMDQEASDGDDRCIRSDRGRL